MGPPESQAGASRQESAPLDQPTINHSTPILPPTSTLDSALRAAARGWYAFPVDHPDLPKCAGIRTVEHDPDTCTGDKRGKHPVVQFTMAATTNPKMIATWWAGPPRNVGINCGKSGLVVIDEDRPDALARYAIEHGEDIPETYTVATGRGQHYYFAVPAAVELGSKAGDLKTYGIDVKAGNAYVVGPGSKHVSGAVYTTTEDREPAVLPDWLITAIRKAQTPATATNGAEPAYTPIPGTPAGLAAVPDVIGDGQRHDTLMRYAASLRARNVPHDEARVLMSYVWRRCDQSTPYGWDEAAGLLADVYARYPAGQLEDEPVDAATQMAMDVGKEFRRLQVQDRARALLAAEKAGPPRPFDAGTLEEILARPPQPRGRIDGLVLWEAGTLIAAQRKTGKTTLLLNLAKSLLTGQDFLGRFGVVPVDGVVSILNFEVGAAQLAAWADALRISRDRLFLVNLRGRRNPFSDPDDQARLAELLRSRGTESILTDPFSRAFPSTKQNDAGEVGAWLAELDRFTRTEVNARDQFLTAHAGWIAERTRGSGALEEWADSIITMTTDKEDDGLHGPRYLHAIGRDVDLEEDQLSYDRATRTLTLAGAGSRKVARLQRNAAELQEAVLLTVTNHPGKNGSEVEEQLRKDKVTFQKGEERAALRALEAAGRVVQTPGKGPAKLWWLPQDVPTSPTSPDLPKAPHGVVVEPPQPPLIGGGSTTGTPDDEPPHDGLEMTCVVCGEPMTVVEAEWTSHPGCIETRSASSNVIPFGPPASRTPRLDEAIKWLAESQAEQRERRARYERTQP
jgi:hypothetical protein